MKRLLFAVAVTALAASLAAPGLAAGGATINLRQVGKLGPILVNSRHHTLYLFEKDSRNKSRCTGTCAKVWSPVRTHGKPQAGKGVRAKLLGSIKRSDGARQVTYAGHPLYTYDDDKKAGTAEGQGSKEFGAKWYVVRSSGKKVDNS